MRSARLKRAFDVVVAGAALVATAVPMAVIAAAVRVTLGAPVLFRHPRPGRHGEPFTLYKFRTMRDDRDADGNLLPDEQRVTRLGGWLRATSLDELPELINVVRGDMSLVGPRPLHIEYLERYTPEQARRHEVRPGLTGLAQVHGRNTLSWEAKFALDVAYVDHWSLWLDLALLARTVAAVAGRRGIDRAGRVGAEPFRGTTSDDQADHRSGRDRRSGRG